MFYGEHAVTREQFSWWLRDQCIARIDLSSYVKKGTLAKELVVKRENLKRWDHIVALAEEIWFRASKAQEFVEVSSQYGRATSRVIELVWRMEGYAAERKFARLPLEAKKARTFVEEFD